MPHPDAVPSPVPTEPAVIASPVLGRFVRDELATPNVRLAAEFYGPVTGWTAATVADGDVASARLVWVGSAGPVGGASPLRADTAGRELHSQWIPYVATPDLDRTFSLALALGGRLVAPPDEATSGRVVVLADPQGAVFALCQPSGATAHPSAAAAPGHVTWHELETTDHRAAFTFYNTLFGWSPLATVDMGPNGPYQVFGGGEVAYGGMFAPTRSPVRPLWRMFVTVADLAGAVAAVRAGGGRVLAGPMPVPEDDCVAHCADDQGALFALHQTGAC